MRLLPEEDQAEYTEHCQGIVASLKPGNPLERHLAQAVADDYWRIERIRRLELTADPDADKPQQAARRPSETPAESDTTAKAA
ncbi:MAG TPA: hypothetical protein VNH18_33640 [Bryobacteraceae bacterium]|nr:hypothetical protein [Bryobacteraceae bacterium]